MMRRSASAPQLLMRRGTRGGMPRGSAGGRFTACPCAAAAGRCDEPQARERHVALAAGRLACAVGTYGLGRVVRGTRRRKLLRVLPGDPHAAPFAGRLPQPWPAPPARCSGAGGAAAALGRLLPCATDGPGPVGCFCCSRRRCCWRRPRARRPTPTRTCSACRPGVPFPGRPRQQTTCRTRTVRRLRPPPTAWASAGRACRWPSRATRLWATGSRAVADRTGLRAFAAAAALDRVCAPRACASAAPRLRLRVRALRCSCHGSRSAASAAASAARRRRH